MRSRIILSTIFSATTVAASRHSNHLITTLVVACFVLLTAAAPASFARGISHERLELYVFGDSLSDSGNALFLLGGITTDPPFTSLIPSAPYASGRFSNGITWIENLARWLRTPDSAKPAYPMSGNNYAVGGARARNSGELTDLPGQVEYFIGTGGSLGRRDWAVVEFGGNDIRDAITTYVVDGEAVAAGILCDAVASIELNIGRLHHEAGARKFFVANGADLGITPGITSLEPFFPGISALGTQLSALFNQLLVDGDTPIPGTGEFGICASQGVTIHGLKSLESSLGNVNLVILDISRLLNTVAKKPKRFGLSNGTDPCIIVNPEPGEATSCAEPDEYLFWDGIHPTAAMHRIVARRAFFTLLISRLKH